MLRVEDWAEIRRLHRAEAMPIKAIARLLGVSKNTVKAAISSDGPPRYERVSRGSIVDQVEPRLHELLHQWPDMPATVIAERIGWTRSMTVLKERVRELRPVYLPPDPASRTTYEPGELAQCDLWFPDVDIPLGAGQNGRGKTPVITMVAGYSRWISGRMIPSRQTEDLFAGQWELIRSLGAVPRALVWDGEGAVGRWRGRRQELTQATQAFRGTLGIKVVLCKPGDPEAKGLVERAHRYFETSFLPGRTFRDPDDFNAQLDSSRGHSVMSRDIVPTCPGSFVTPQPHKRPRSSWIRFEAQLPNERWQSDVTHWRMSTVRVSLLFRPMDELVHDFVTLYPGQRQRHEVLGCK